MSTRMPKPDAIKGAASGGEMVMYVEGNFHDTALEGKCVDLERYR